MTGDEPQLLDVIIKIVGIILGPAVFGAVVTFIASVYLGRRQQHRREQQIIRALLAEIQRLVDDLCHDRYSEESRKAVRDVVSKDKDRKVLISYGRKDDFLYRELKTEITVLPSQTLTPVVAFYGQLAYLYAIIDDIQSETFGQISLAGRGAVIDELYDNVKSLRESGIQALESLLEQLPKPPERAQAKAWIADIRARLAKLQAKPKGGDAA